jgi:hypothetical protein
VTVTEGPDKGKTFLGIYELSSDDYKVSFAPAGKERPTELSSKPGSGNLLQFGNVRRSSVAGRSQNSCDDQRPVIVSRMAVGESFHGTQYGFEQGRGSE